MLVCSVGTVALAKYSLSLSEFLYEKVTPFRVTLQTNGVQLRTETTSQLQCILHNSKVQSFRISNDIHFSFAQH